MVLGIQVEQTAPSTYNFSPIIQVVIPANQPFLFLYRKKPFSFKRSHMQAVGLIFQVTGVLFRNSFLLSSESLKVLGLTLRSSIHVELTFVQGRRSCCGFIVLHVHAQFPLGTQIKGWFYLMNVNTICSLLGFQMKLLWLDLRNLKNYFYFIKTTKCC